jgi:hypothetical protein
LARGIRAAQVFPGDSKLAYPDSSHSRQAYSFLNLAMHRDAAQSRSFPVFCLAAKQIMDRISCSVKSFYRYRKSDNMANVSTFLKCVISLAVVFGILYVLISPLPEVDATFSGKSALSYFILITHSLLGLFFFTFLVRFRPLEWIASAHGNVLNMICVRLC